MEEFEDFDERLPEILGLMQSMDTWALFDHPACATYYKSRVCVIGDVAHASTPFQGAGAGMAIEDAYVMSNLLSQVKSAPDIEDAFKAFDAVRTQRTQRLVKTSREAGMLWDFELEGVGDDADNFRENLDGMMGWIWNEDLAAEVKEANKIMSQSAHD